MIYPQRIELSLKKRIKCGELNYFFQMIYWKRNN